MIVDAARRGLAGGAVLALIAGSMFTVGYYRGPSLFSLTPIVDPPRSTPEKKQEIALVYIGSSSCGPSNNPRLPSYLETVRQDLVVRARTVGLGFTTLGIARDLDTSAGFRHLAALGPFDQVVVGRSWLNLGLSRYVYDALPGLPATPQILITMREVDVEAAGGRIESERVILRKIGAKEISEWIVAGLSLTLEGVDEISGRNLRFQED